MLRVSIGAITGGVPTKKAAVVVERKTLFDGGAIVKVRVPMDAKERSYPSEGEVVRFLQFATPIRGGHVNMFVHTKDLSRLRGAFITARASVRKKVLDDGREFIHVDLVPFTEQNVRATHRLVIANEDVTTLPAPQHVFDTPEPLKAQILFAALSAKVVPVQ